MSSNHGPRTESLSSMVRGKTLTAPPKASSAANEKAAFDNDVDSVYDEEESPKTREGDFKHKQVRQDSYISKRPFTDQSARSSKAGAYSCTQDRKL